MGFFNKILVQENTTGNLVDITKLDEKHYESFLNAMEKLQSAYIVAKNKTIEVETIQEAVERLVPNETIQLPFDWRFFNVVINKKTTEKHYKCHKTGAFKCKEFKYGNGIKSITYSLPDSEEYDIKTEEELLKKIQK